MNSKYHLCKISIITSYICKFFGIYRPIAVMDDMAVTHTINKDNGASDGDLQTLTEGYQYAYYAIVCITILVTLYIMQIYT